MKNIVILLYTVMFAGCGYSNTSLPGGSSGGANGGLDSGTKMDFAAVKAQFFVPQCIRCHSNSGGNKGGVNLETYANVKSRLSSIQSAVNGGFMPPAGPLPASTKNILNNWITSGAPEFASTNPGGGGDGSTSPLPNPGNPGNSDDDHCDDDLRLDGYIKIQNELYFDSVEQLFVEIQKRGRGRGRSGKDTDACD
jgi:hypothetical protein